MGSRVVCIDIQEMMQQRISNCVTQKARGFLTRICSFDKMGDERRKNKEGKPQDLKGRSDTNIQQLA